jgi:hypothetical protein
VRARFLVVGAVIVSVQLARCGDPTEETPELPDVIYDGEASDEAWEVLWPRLADAEVKASLQLVAPSGTVEAAPPPTFTWGARASLSPRFPGRAWPLPFLAPPAALAHLPPVSGTVVVLEIRGAELVRVFTTEGSWTPVAAEWQRITGGAAREVSVRLYSAYLNANVVEEGPFVSPAPATFHVEAP